MRAHTQGEHQREREKRAPHGAGILTCDLILGPRDHDTSQRQTVNRLSHPDATAVLTFVGESTLLGLEAVVKGFFQQCL